MRKCQPQEVLEAVCKVTGVPYDFLGVSRNRRFPTQLRRLTAYMLHERCGMTRAEIGGILGRSESMMYTGIAEIRNRLKTDRRLQNLRDRINSHLPPIEDELKVKPKKTVLKPSMRSGEKKRRSCLHCRTVFKSRWNGERICPRCKSSDEWQSAVQTQCFRPMP